MKLIVGLGNPDKKYEHTWHNAGFLALDQIQNKEFTKFKVNSKFKAEIAEGQIGQEKIILAKPQTFMNDSGMTVALLVNYYDINMGQELMVIHDDNDIELGKIKPAFDSSSAGHRGVQSIIDQLGSQKFNRLRIGIKSEKQGQISTDIYVLQKIDKQSKVAVDQVIKKTAKAVEATIIQGIDKAMNEYN